MRQNQKNKYLDVSENRKNIDNLDKNFLDNIIQITQKKNITTEEIKNIIIDSFKDVYIKHENCDITNEDLECEFLNSFIVYRKFKIVNCVKDNIREINSSDEKIEKNISRDNFCLIPLDINSLSFSSIQEIRNIVQKKIYKIQRFNQIKNIKKNINDLIRGKVVSFIANKHYNVELENGCLSLWPISESDSPTFLVMNKSFLFLIKDIQESDDGRITVILTRSGDEYIKKLLELEIPEIRNGIIKIIHVFRKSGVLTKVLVKSTLSYIDAIGTCIGKSASRIRKIGENIFKKEKIEISLWDEDTENLVLNLLLPVKAISIFQEDDTIKIIIHGNYLISNSLIQNGSWFIEGISSFIKKKILLIAYREDIDENSINVWNGNMSYPEYLRFKQKN